MIRRSRGSSIIEVLTAMLIIGVSIAGAVSLFAYSMNLTRRSDESSIAMNIARRAIEATKTQGFRYAPEGTTQYEYDRHGTLLGQVGGGDWPEALYRAAVTIESDRLAWSPDTSGYRPTDTAIRTLTIRVSNLTTGVEVYRHGTLMARSGI